jgi:putative transport protein
MRKFFGDSIKTTAEFSYIGIGIGMALGFLLGAIQFPLPAIGKISLGLSGVLIMALILGKLRRTRGMSWTIPLSANIVIRNLGLTLSSRKSAWPPARSSPRPLPTPDS